MDQIAVCLPVLENYAKLQEQMSNRKYYQALKTLEELEHTHLALVEKYRFTQVLAKSMAPVRLEIKEKAYSEFKDFLENIKKVAGRIGKHASKDVSINTSLVFCSFQFISSAEPSSKMHLAENWRCLPSVNLM